MVLNQSDKALRKRQDGDPRERSENNRKSAQSIEKQILNEPRDDIGVDNDMAYFDDCARMV
jgi:hypothetical protein